MEAIKWSIEKRPVKKLSQNLTAAFEQPIRWGSGQKNHSINRWSRPAEAEVFGMTDSFGHVHQDNHRTSRWPWEAEESLWNDWLIQSCPWRPSPNQSVVLEGRRMALEWSKHSVISTRAPPNQSVRLLRPGSQLPDGYPAQYHRLIWWWHCEGTESVGQGRFSTYWCNG
jgi:hypothetical protein